MGMVGKLLRGELPRGREKTSMNIRRGLIRTWVVVGILWVGICALGWDIGSGFDRERYDEYIR